MLKHNLQAWCLILIGGFCAWAEPLADTFTIHRSGPQWQAQTAVVPNGMGGLDRAIVASFPGKLFLNAQAAK